MAKLFKDGYFQPNDTVGRSLAGAKLFFYTAGTTSPKNTYTSKDLSSTNVHPVVADAAGRFPPIWLDGTYDVELKDSSNVLIDTLEDVGATDETINTTASLQFKTLADLKALEAQNGLTVDPDIGDALHTTGKTTTTDDEGADWVVVAAGTGTPDDDTYVDLANGLQAERVFNNLYRKNNGSDIENAGTFRSNIDVYSTGEATSEFLNETSTFTSIWSGSSTSVDLTVDPPGGDPGDGLLLVRYTFGDILVMRRSGVATHASGLTIRSASTVYDFYQCRLGVSGTVEVDKFDVDLSVPSISVSLDTITEIFKVN